MKVDEREVAEELVDAVHRAIKVCDALMESEDVDVKVFAIDSIIKLAEMEMALLDALGERAVKEERNPLARRAKL